MRPPKKNWCPLAMKDYKRKYTKASKVDGKRDRDEKNIPNETKRTHFCVSLPIVNIN